MRIEHPNFQSFVINQLFYIKKLEMLPLSALCEVFRTLRHKVAFVSYSRPDVLVPMDILSPVTSKTFTPTYPTRINSVVQYMHSTKDVTFQFVTLDKSTLRLIVFSSGPFAKNEELSWQSKYIVLWADKSWRANILHCSSTKTNRIVRSI